jgi:chromosomal replication initiator protein
VARLTTGSSFAAIGAYFGGRNPATVRHACKAAAERITKDPALAAAVATMFRLPREPDTNGI